MENIIREKVHNLYWDLDINCARAMLTCLGDLFQVQMNEQTLNAAIGLHGAGGFRSQCGLVEGALMFIGIYLSKRGKTDDEISRVCYQFAEKFARQFGSLRCYDLRPNGFTDGDPPHACEGLSANAIFFAYQFLNNTK